MAGTLYPGALDNGTSLPDPGPNSDTAAFDHAGLHDANNAAIKAIETKVGVNSSADTNSIDYKLTQAIGNIATNATTMNSHIANISNPHATTAAQVGLGNVDNTSDATKNAATVTLTNKTIDGNSNTFTNIPITAISSTSGTLQPWTPTLNNWAIGTGGSAGTVAKSIQIGKLVFFYIKSTLGTTGSSVSGSVSFSLPTSIDSTFGGAFFEINSCYVRSAGTLYEARCAIAPTVATINVLLVSGTRVVSQTISSTIPNTWTSGDSFLVSGFYIAA